MSKKISLSKLFIFGQEYKYIKECLDTGWVSSAEKFVNLFEEKVANYTGAKFAIACSNATSAYNVRDLERMECFSAKCLSSFFIYNMSQTRDKRESEGWKPNGA